MAAPYVVDYIKKPSLLDRHIAWLRKPGGFWSRIAKSALGVLEASLLTLSLVGIPFAAEGISRWARARNEDRFQQSLKNLVPPDAEPIRVPTSQQTFNHLYDYALKDNVIWYRARNSAESWQAIYFDGYPKRKPKKIDVDGANLIIIDDKKQIHYKKVIKEYRTYRPREVKKMKRGEHLKHLRVGKRKSIQLPPDSSYIVVNKNSLNNWKPEWFSLPGLSGIVNLFQGKRLKVPSGSKSIAISHRGRYNDYIDDAVGQEHLVGEGVTTLYVLGKEGRDIRKFDPWSPKHADVRIYFPETPSTVFVAKKIAASASTIMAIGYDIDLATNTKTLKIITRLADIDTMGWNPYLKYAHSQKDNPKVRVLPIGMGEDGEEWQEHALPEGVKITGKFSIRQTGKGNQAREMMVEGTNERGVWGVFSKKITDKQWQFEALNQHAANEDKAVLLENQKNGLKNKPKTTMHDYQCQKKSYQVKLENFGEHGYCSNIVLMNGEKQYILPLIRRHGLASFLGAKMLIHEIVLSKELQEDPFIQRLFSTKKFPGDVVKVDVTVSKNNVKIHGAAFEWKMSLDATRELNAKRS